MSSNTLAPEHTPTRNAVEPVTVETHTLEDQLETEETTRAVDGYPHGCFRLLSGQDMVNYH